MACVSTATATQFTTITSVGSSVSTSSSVTTIPASVTTIVSQSCVIPGLASGSASGGGCLSSTEVTQTSTIAAGGVSTVAVPVTVTFTSTQTQPTATLYAPCSGSSSSTSQSSSTTSTASSTQLTTSSFITLSTPPPTVITSQSSTTLADGAVVPTIVTVTSTLPATSIAVTTVLTGASKAAQQATNNNGNSNLGPIIGGVVGGVVGLIAIIAFIWFLLRRRQNFDAIFEKNIEDEIADARPVRHVKDRNRRLDLIDEPEPRPYQYGLVGHVTPSRVGSPPNSPPPDHAAPANFLDRRPSAVAPLNLPPSASAPAIGMGSRPSTGGSVQPLMQQRPPLSPHRSSSPPSSHAGHSNSHMSLANWNPNTDAIVDFEDSAGSPTTPAARRVLQVANLGDTPSSSAGDIAGPASPSKKPPRESPGSPEVFVHRDGGRVEGASSSPPAYSPK